MSTRARRPTVQVVIFANSLLFKIFFSTMEFSSTNSGKAAHGLQSAECGFQEEEASSELGWAQRRSPDQQAQAHKPGRRLLHPLNQQFPGSS